MTSVPRKKCLFLFNELAGYAVSCLKKLSLQEHVEVHVFRYPVNQIAPFRFSLDGDHLHFYNRPDFSVEQLTEKVNDIQPDLILCGGWSDKGYLRVCSTYKKSIPVILGFDNPWRGTFKQHLASFIGPFLVHKYFNYCWVAGLPQRIYARKIGFSHDRIKDDVYSCDYEFFHEMYLRFRPQKALAFPKRIIFIGRYTKLKGASELWQAFIKFQEESPSEWELWCLGKGDLESEFPKHEKIKNIGFVQPSEMAPYISGSGVFILPSHYEHWGVVVHEFAAAGFPLICSTTTSAATTFLKDGYNGFLHEPCSVDSLVKVFHKIKNTPITNLLEMGDRSAVLAEQITPSKWAKGVVEYFETR